jgi:TrkA domain protein
MHDEPDEGKGRAPRRRGMFWTSHGVVTTGRRDGVASGGQLAPWSSAPAIVEDTEIVDLEETKLPGVGLRHDFTTARGRRIGVISTRGGERELLVYSQDDPDACHAVIDLDGDEAEVLAELLGQPRVIERLARLREQIEGLATEGIYLEDGSPYVGKTLADAAIRSRTGASVVALVRNGEVTPSPAPSQAFLSGDKIVVVGTQEGVRATAELLHQG